MSYVDRTLYLTWQLSFDHIKQQNDLSAKILQLWAYFDNQDVWFELLHHGDKDDPDWFLRLTDDEVEFTKAMRVLCNHSLAEVYVSSDKRVESGGYGMHSCVHAWTMHVLNQEADIELARLALKCVASHAPRKEANKPWITQRRLIQHGIRCWYMAEEGVIEWDGLEWAWHSCGNLFSDQGRLGEAEKMYDRALQGYEKAWGSDHTETLDTVNNLGNLYARQGRLEEAEKMYDRALQGYEKALGSTQVRTFMPALNTMENLAYLCAETDRRERAKVLYLRALPRLEAVLGSESTRCKGITAAIESL